MAITKTKETVFQIPVNQILPDPNQPRHDFNEAENIELAKSIKEYGVIQPIVIRLILQPTVCKYMVVVGHRRLWAVKYNKMATIDAVIKELSDDEALEWQIIENLQRKGINPMEESDAFAKLMKAGLTTAEMISDRLGVSTKYVYDRLALQRVVPEVQEAVRKGTLSITHGKQFARLPIFDQAKLLEEVDLNEPGLTVADIRSEISDTFKLKLEDAVFDIEDARLVKSAGACAMCTKRSGCNILLFEDVKQDDVCFDSSCYNLKLQAHIDQQIESLKTQGKTVKLLSTKYRSDKSEYVCNNEWDELDEDETSNTVGIIMEINQWDQQYKYGQVINIEDDKADEKEVSGQTSYNNSTPRERSIDYNEVFAVKCVEVVLERYKNNSNFPPADQWDMIAEAIVAKFWRLGDATQVAIFNTLGIKRMEDDAEDECSKEAVQRYFEELQIPAMLQLLSLFRTLDEVESFENCPDQEEIEKVQVQLKDVGIDFFQIAQEVGATYPLFTPTSSEEVEEDETETVEED